MTEPTPQQQRLQSMLDALWELREGPIDAYYHQLRSVYELMYGPYVHRATKSVSIGTPRHPEDFTEQFKPIREEA